MKRFKGRAEIEGFLDAAMKASGADSPTDLARKCDLAPATLTRFFREKDVDTMNVATMNKISLETVVPSPLEWDYIQKRAKKESSSHSRFVETGPALASLGRNLPVFGTEAGSIAGVYKMNLPGAPAAIQDYTDRPAFLTSQDAYSIRIKGDYNAPVIPHGALVYIDPSRPPMIGLSVCIRLRDGTAMITRLLSYGPGGSVRAESWAGVAACIKADMIEAVHSIEQIRPRGD